ncbi:hypothetical protein Poli38472_010937 [Pythium oligandrum]|uniref:Uncharacterized protein n=1 Tax=Pythium oligandrum TaxID=41045 RepID=A0A8K1FIA5_PYTOL|nr:hypothetical protein Poli38472_010937 [Pythium oligandrum]|eukprot:TMW61874.1 hypothetical protein Poli38472_010937 [Pythium oligandrum]
MEEANCPDELKRMLQHSRPLFAWYCLEYLERNACPRPMTLDYLDGMVTHVATEITSVKSRSELGQFDLLLCASLTLTSTRPTLIDTHFAQLDDEDPLSLSIDAKDNLYVDNVPWKCRCVFPSADRDVLLHLSLTTGRGSQTLKSPLHKMMEVPANREGMYWPDVDAKTDDGMALEPLVSAAMVLASHKGGLGGVAFPAFLGGFLYQLGVTRTDEPMELPGTAGVVVPFLSAPNVEWPLWLLEDWQSLGTLLATSIGQIAKTALTSGLNLT